MVRFGLALGANLETLLGLAGVGDVILTCTDNQSRNRRFGLALAQGKTVEQAKIEIGQIVEAMDNSAGVCKLARQHNISMPICSQINMVLGGKISPKQALVNAMK